MGWGLTDLTAGKRDHWRADPRVNWDSRLLKYEGASPQEYFRWLEERRRASESKFSFSLDWASLAHTDAGAKRDLSRCLTYNPEFGMPTVLVLTPLGKPDWSRYDDDMDYTMETYLRPRKAQTNHVEVLPHPPFPFNGFYMDNRTGERLNDRVMWWIRARSNFDSLPRAGRAAALEGLDLLAAECTPYADHEEASRYVIPQVPEEIRDLAEYGELFTEPDVWLQLRPVLYTYWG
jgi:hypothetical protein